jgi:hypothetical protein
MNRLETGDLVRVLRVRTGLILEARIGDVKGAALDAGSSTKPGLKCPVSADERAAI